MIILYLKKNKDQYSIFDKIYISLLKFMTVFAYQSIVNLPIVILIQKTMYYVLMEQKHGGKQRVQYFSNEKRRFWIIINSLDEFVILFFIKFFNNIDLTNTSFFLKKYSLINSWRLLIYRKIEIFFGSSAFFWFIFLFFF